MDTIKQKRQLMHRLLFKLGVSESKPDLLAQYGAKSTTELSEHQLDELTYRLQIGMYHKSSASAEVRKWRSNALTLINKCGVYATNNDWSEVNSFMLNPRICGKLLYELNEDGLKDLCKKLRSIIDKNTKNYRNKLMQVNLN